MEIRTSGQREDRVTGAIEAQTSKVPTSGYLAAAVSSMAASAILKIAGKDQLALFVGQWAPAFLIMGVYNKMVKQHGSDAFSQPSEPLSPSPRVTSMPSPSVSTISNSSSLSQEHSKT